MPPEKPLLPGAEESQYWCSRNGLGATVAHLADVFQKRLTTWLPSSSMCATSDGP